MILRLSPHFINLTKLHKKTSIEFEYGKYRLYNICTCKYFTSVNITAKNVTIYVYTY